MNPFDELETHFAEIVRLMKPQFDSHQFILKLAEKNQRLYVQALAQYPDSDEPFMIVHGQIARRLAKHTDLVQSEGKDPRSPNIFGNKSEAEKWRKV